jgi:hypothetical protein
MKPDPTISVDLTAREVHVLICAMAGNHPASLRAVRMPALRKLAKAKRLLDEALEAGTPLEGAST